VSHWTPSSQEQGSNNKNTYFASHTGAFNNEASQWKQQQQQQHREEQSKHPPLHSVQAVNQQQQCSSKKVSKDKLFTSHNKSPREAFTPPGQASQSILESLLAKNILAQGHSTSSSSSSALSSFSLPSCVRVTAAMEAGDTRVVRDASKDVSSSPSPSTGKSEEQHQILQTKSNKEFTESKVNRRKAFIVRRVVQSTTQPLGQMEKSQNTCHDRSTGGPSVLFKETPETKYSPTVSPLVSNEQPLDLSTKKLTKQSNGRPVIVNSIQSSRVKCSRQAAPADQHSVEYLIRSVEQSAAEAASCVRA